MFFAAFMSRSYRVPQDGHVQCLVARLRSASKCPHAEHVLDDGYQRSMTVNCRPYRWHLYSHGSSMPAMTDKTLPCHAGTGFPVRTARLPLPPEVSMACCGPSQLAAIRRSLQAREYADIRPQCLDVAPSPDSWPMAHANANARYRQPRGGYLRFRPTRVRPTRSGVGPVGRPCGAGRRGTSRESRRRASSTSIRSGWGSGRRRPTGSPLHCRP